MTESEARTKLAELEKIRPFIMNIQYKREREELESFLPQRCENDWSSYREEFDPMFNFWNP